MMEGYLLGLIVTLPLVVALLMLFVPSRFVGAWRTAALVLAVIELGLCFLTYLSFVSEGVLETRFSWLMLSFGAFGQLKVDFHLKTDGLNMSLILLSSVVFFVSTLSSYDIKKYTKGYYLLLFLLTSAVFGCFLAHDFLLFFLFFEFMLLPMYFLVGIWGGERREYAAIKFFLYTLLGSVFILLVLIGTYGSVFHPLEMQNMAGSGGLSINQMLAEGMLNSSQIIHSLDFDYIFNSKYYIDGSLLDKTLHVSVWGMDVRTLMFVVFLTGFAIKLPVSPLHTWLPDAHVEAPTAVSVVLAGVLLKIGGYGIIKLVMPLFPDLFVQHAFWIAAFGVFSMLYGGLNALAQTDLKKLIAYSSVAHMGFVMLGTASLTAEGVHGAMFQMVSHGVISSFLFLLAGVVYERTHDRTIAHYRGLAAKMPYFTILSVVAYFAALGLPVFSGFIAELTVYMGAFQAASAGILPFWLVMLALLALLVGAAYCLWVLQRMFFGEYWIKPSLSHSPMPDLTVREWCMLLPLALLTVLLGVFPGLVFDLFKIF
jgi:NADH-quinone oxidoreductase subunit M